MSALIANRKPVSNYRPPLRTRDLPLPPRWTPREKAIAQTRLTQFVILSMLLHALAILLFGAPTGGSREGRAMFGSLDVVIREAYRSAPTPPAPVQPVPTPAPVAKQPVPAPPPPPPETQAPPPRPIEFPPLLDRLAPSEVKIEPAVEFKVPPPETPLPERLLQPLPTLPQRSTLPSLEAVPAIRAPVEAPKLPSQLLQPLPSLPERSALPPVEAPVIKLPPELPSIPAPLLQPLSPLPERSALPAVERTPVPAPPVETRAPPVEAPRAPPVEAPRTPPAEAPRTPPADVQRTPPADVSRTPPAETARPPASPPIVREPAVSPFRAPVQRPDDSTYDPTKPSLDLDAVRKRAAEITRQGTGNRAALPFPMPPVEKPKTKMEKAIENARKPDCREAYKALGLAAVVPLIANEFGEGTCRW